VARTAIASAGVFAPNFSMTAFPAAICWFNVSICCLIAWECAISNALLASSVASAATVSP
jgi:hypothetical protein